MNPLSEALRDLADDARAYDVTERALKRARRRRWFSGNTFPVLAGATAVVILAVVVMLPMFALNRVGPNGSDGGPRIASPIVTALIESPTRGSLAGDGTFLTAIRNEAAGASLGGIFGIGGDRMPSNPADLRVLFAGDVPGGRRIAIVAAAVGPPMLANYSGRTGAAAGRLDMTGWGDIDEPIIQESWSGSDVSGSGPGYSLVFGPADYAVEVSERPRYLANGTTARTWAPEPAGFVLRGTPAQAPGLRVRFSKDTHVLYEGRLVAPGRRLNVSVDPAPLFGRGQAVPAAAQAAAQALAFSSGLNGDGVQYVVLWSDDYEVNDPDGGGSGTGSIATVLARTPDGGGPFLTIAFDAQNPPTARTHPTGEGIMGDPATALVAMRLPHWVAEISDDLQLIAPPTAVRAEILRDGRRVAETGLDRGVGRLTVPAPAEVTVRAYDAAGQPVAETRFSDNIDNRMGGNGVEPEIRGW